MADDALDELYWVKPEEFTAVRSRLAAAARDHDDADAAKRISAARKPTTAAWVVNRLALSHAKTKQRLADLRERLLAAHAEMDGDRIRELSKDQRKLIDELTKSAFETAEMTDPSAALRDDVVGTLQAAVADSDVNARLGRLAKAESWSGFGDLGATATVATVTRPKPKVGPEQLERAKAALAEAEQAKADADRVLSKRKADVIAAERALRAADEAREQAKQASREADDVVRAAREELKRLQ
jgi:Outer membrane efflux protein